MYNYNNYNDYSNYGNFFSGDEVAIDHGQEFMDGDESEHTEGIDGEYIDGVEPAEDQKIDNLSEESSSLSARIMQSKTAILEAERLKALSDDLGSIYTSILKSGVTPYKFNSWNNHGAFIALLRKVGAGMSAESFAYSDGPRGPVSRRTRRAILAMRSRLIRQAEETLAYI